MRMLTMPENAAELYRLGKSARLLGYTLKPSRGVYALFVNEWEALHTGPLDALGEVLEDEYAELMRYG